MPGKATCWGHDPANAERRRQIAQKANRAGGKGRPSPARDEVTEIRQLLRALFGKVYKGEMERGDAIALNLLLNTRLRLVELERKIAEAEEFEARLAALEAAGPPAQGSTRWRA